MKRLVLLGLYFTLSLVLVLGTSFYYSPGALAVDMEGNMDGDGGGGNDGNNMPPPEDAPATTDALTAGGGSDDDDSEGDEENDNDNDNDKDDPQIPKDAPATTNTLTAKKIECQPGQEVPLFSTTCQPVPQPQQSSVTGCETQQAASEEEEPEFSPSNEGNYDSHCTPSLQFGNTGNFQNNAEFLKEGGSVGEFEPGGIEFATEPENEEGCTGTTTANGQCSNTIIPTPTPVPAP